MVSAFYIYGILLSVVSIGFYVYDLVHETVEDSRLKMFLKFLFSMSTAWLLCGMVFLSCYDVSPASYSMIIPIVMFVSPLIGFIGFQMFLYGFFDRK